MSNTSKGSAWVRLVAEEFRRAGAKVSRRPWRQAGDDLTVVKAGSAVLSVEAKNHRALNLAAFVDQAEANAGADEVPIVVVKRRGKAAAGEGYVVMKMSTFLGWWSA